eukprot:scaffold3340_cov114-Isochrysis_galbana.AAC.6
MKTLGGEDRWECVCGLTAPSELVVSAAEDHVPDAHLAQRGGAHDARLDRHIQRALGDLLDGVTVRPDARGLFAGKGRNPSLEHRCRCGRGLPASLWPKRRALPRGALDTAAIWTGSCG